MATIYYGGGNTNLNSSGTNSQGGACYSWWSSPPINVYGSINSSGTLTLSQSITLPGFAGIYRYDGTLVGYLNSGGTGSTIGLTYGVVTSYQLLVISQGTQTSVPTTADTVYITAACGACQLYGTTGPGGYGIAAFLLDATGSYVTITGAGGSANSLGSCILGANTTVGPAYRTFLGNALAAGATSTITCNGSSFGIVYFQAAVNYVCTDLFKTDGQRLAILYQGTSTNPTTLTTNAGIDVGQFTTAVSSGSYSTINMGNYDWTLRYYSGVTPQSTLDNPTINFGFPNSGTTVNKGNANIVFAGTQGRYRGFCGNGQTFNSLKILLSAGGVSTYVVHQSNTFSSIEVNTDSPSYLQFSEPNTIGQWKMTGGVNTSWSGDLAASYTVGQSDLTLNIAGGGTTVPQGGFIQLGTEVLYYSGFTPNYPSTGQGYFSNVQGGQYNTIAQNHSVGEVGGVANMLDVSPYSMTYVQPLTVGAGYWTGSNLSPSAFIDNVRVGSGLENYGFQYGIQMITNGGGDPQCMCTVNLRSGQYLAGRTFTFTALTKGKSSNTGSVQYGQLFIYNPTVTTVGSTTAVYETDRYTVCTATVTFPAGAPYDSQNQFVIRVDPPDVSSAGWFFYFSYPIVREASGSTVQLTVSNPQSPLLVGGVAGKVNLAGVGVDSKNGIYNPNYLQLNSLNINSVRNYSTDQKPNMFLSFFK